MKFLLIIACFFGLIIANAQAQSDSVRTEYVSEDEKISRSEIQRVIRYITRANVEEKTLIKLGGLPNSIPFTQNGNSLTGGLSLELAIERKIHPSFSLLFGFDNDLNANFYQPVTAFIVIPGNTPYWVPYRIFGISSSAKAAMRYYYGMARRIREGKSANNFSGTYLAFQARRPILSYSFRKLREVSSGDIRDESEVLPVGTLNTPSFSLQWGIQQRIGRRGYLDLNAGPEVTVYDNNRAHNYNNDSRTQLSLRISATIGLGW